MALLFIKIRKANKKKSFIGREVREVTVPYFWMNLFCIALFDTKVAYQIKYVSPKDGLNLINIWMCDIFISK